MDLHIFEKEEEFRKDFMIHKFNLSLKLELFKSETNVLPIQYSLFECSFKAGLPPFQTQHCPLSAPSEKYGSCLIFGVAVLLVFFLNHVTIKERPMQGYSSFFCPVAKALFRYPFQSDQMIRIYFEDSKYLMKSGGAPSAVTNQRICHLSSITIVCS